MQNSMPQLKKETWKERLLFHWIGFRVLVYLAEIAVPLLIDALCGHVWGAVASVVNIIIWLYCGIKAHVSFGIRVMWTVAFVYVVLIAVVEFAHVFHWQLTSNGHF
jgi:hypothetical protein